MENISKVLHKIVEQIYKERDAQLRSVLHVVATKFLSHANTDAVMQEADAINADVVEGEIDEWVSLKSFLKLKRIKEQEKKRLKGVLNRQLNKRMNGSVFVAKRFF